jgi:hypothetical protein
MKKLISAKLAGKIMLVLMSALIIFHLLILFKIIPSDIVWGGKIENSETGLVFTELISLIITLIFMIIIAAKIKNPLKYKKLINIEVWIIFIYFVLNIFGNLASESPIEKLIFIPLTLILSFLALRLAIEK